MNSDRTTPPGDTLTVDSRLRMGPHTTAVTRASKSQPDPTAQPARGAATPPEKGAALTREIPLEALTHTPLQVALPILCIEAALAD